MVAKQNKKIISSIQAEEAEKQINKCSKKIGYSINEYTIGYLADEMQKPDGEFYIPDYQRFFVWDDKRKSRFIESILLGLPIPFLFYYENTRTGKLEIIDGSQRLRTILAFVHQDFRLENLKCLTELNGFRFSDLSASRRQKVRNRSIRGILINEKADPAARQDLFNRINTGSQNATPAEIRKGSLPGKFMDLIYELSQKAYFRELTPRAKSKEDSREHEELVTRFFAYSNDLKNYKGVVEPFLFDYVGKTNKAFEKNPQLAVEYEQEFKQVMDYVAKHFPNGFKKAETVKSVSRVRFESIAVGVAIAIERANGIENLKTQSIPDWVDCEEYRVILRADGGNVTSKLKRRIYYVAGHLLGIDPTTM